MRWPCDYCDYGEGRCFELRAPPLTLALSPGYQGEGIRGVRGEGIRAANDNATPLGVEMFYGG
jgi:hypothetical protein